MVEGRKTPVSALPSESKSPTSGVSPSAPNGNEKKEKYFRISYKEKEEYYLKEIIKVFDEENNTFLGSIILLKNITGFKELDEVKSGVYDITPQLREEILLEIPHFLECHRGECPSRQEIEKYLITGEDSKEDTYHPFTEL